MIEFLLPPHLKPSFPLRDALAEVFYPVGFPLRIVTNSDAVLRAASAEWDVWTQSFDHPEIVLNFQVSEDRPTLPAISEFHAHGHNFAFVADAKNLAVCDTRTRSGVAWITSAAAEDAVYLRYHFMEAMALEMIVSLYMTPFHAGCVARDGRAILLVGDSGAGKSSMSYGCARRGWTYLSDDACYLMRDRAEERMVYGHPHRVRLRPDAPKLFPELKGCIPSLRANGKMSLEIRTDTLPISSATNAVVDRIVLLHRNASGPSSLTRVDASAAREICEPIFYWWDQEISAAQQSAFDTLLAAAEVFSLEYSHVDAAIDLLEK